MNSDDCEFPSENEGALCLPAEIDHLPVFLDQICRLAAQAGLSDPQVSRLELAVEEALVNVCNHAYSHQSTAGIVQCQIKDQTDGFQVEIIDEGIPFDPLARSDPDTTMDLDDRQLGGLGVLLIKRLTDEVVYRRQDTRNVLIIRMRKTTATPSDTVA